MSVLSFVTDIDSTGPNEILSVSGNQVIQVMKVYVNPSADITGDILVKLGDSVIGGATNLIAGGNHPLVSICGKYVQGGRAKNLSVVLPDTTACKVTFHGEVKP